VPGAEQRPTSPVEGAASGTFAVLNRVGNELLHQMQRSPAEALREFLGETIWRWELSELPWIQRRIVQVLRLVYLVGRGFVSSRAQQQAMALTYTTMLALVPAFAIIIALFSARGLQQFRGRLESFLIDALSASPDQRRMLSSWLNDLAENLAGGGVAGAAFFVFLFLTIIALLSTLEKTLNDIWNIKRQRSFINRFVTYWCVATLGPILLGIALVQGSSLEYRLWEAAAGVRHLGQDLISAKPTPTPTPSPSATPAEDEPEDELLFGGVGGAFARQLETERAAQDAKPPPAEGQPAPAKPKGEQSIEFLLTGTRRVDANHRDSVSLVAFGLTVITFTLIYAFIPNTTVRLKPALWGALVATIMWALTRWALTASSATLVRYNTVYGSLATIPITMFWLYLSWLIVILGAELTFALQNLRTQRKEELATETTALFKETVALRMCARIAEAFERGEAPPNLEELAELTGAPVSLCAGLLFHLVGDGLLRESERKEGSRGYVPARPLDRITISDIVDSLRERKGIAFDLARGDDLEVVQRHLDQANAASKALASRTTLRRVVLQLHEELLEQEQAVGSSVDVTPETAAAGALSAETVRRITARSERVREEPRPKEASEASDASAASAASAAEPATELATPGKPSADLARTTPAAPPPAEAPPESPNQEDAAPREP